MKNIIFLLIIFFVASCSKLEFVYKDSKNLTNPLYEKTRVSISGFDIVYINSYVPMFFGKDKDAAFNLLIDIKEKKTKRSVETNQATSNLRYELRFSYVLTSNTKNCVTYKKEILSYFNITPKSEGYNYGSDTSLEKKYELAVTDNLNQFVSFLSGTDINSCS